MLLIANATIVIRAPGCAARSDLTVIATLESATFGIVQC